MMDYDCTPEELSKRIDALVAKYPDRYDAEEDEDEGTKVVRIKSELMQPAPDFLGDVMDEVFGTDNIKQKGGAIGLLTHNQLSRSSVYYQALILALIPFVNPEHFPI